MFLKRPSYLWDRLSHPRNPQTPQLKVNFSALSSGRREQGFLCISPDGLLSPGADPLGEAPLPWYGRLGRGAYPSFQSHWPSPFRIHGYHALDKGASSFFPLFPSTPSPAFFSFFKPSGHSVHGILSARGGVRSLFHGEALRLPPANPCPVDCSHGPLCGGVSQSRVSLSPSRPA